MHGDRPNGKAPVSQPSPKRDWMPGFRLQGAARTAAAAAAIGLLVPACSVKKFAVRQVGDALSSGTSVYETDPDIDLVGGALPFSLKFLESLLDVTPRHRGLLVSAAKGFALYSLAYVDMPGEILIEQDFQAGKALRERARRLYLRSLGYSMRALETAYPGIAGEFGQAPEHAARRVQRKHVDLLYWAGAALGLSISTDPTNPALVVRLGEVDAMVGRALELDESWDQGSLHEFLLRLEAARPGAADKARVESSFRRALDLSGGRRAGLYVAYAESFAVPAQDRALFDELLDKALAMDADEFEEYRLLNHLAQRRAQWLRSRTDDLFF
ncbi:MAG: TRAP transporter TatT component family protein [Bryobacterales bacterium]|nr:TRAP transporter TatT component family protein [Bryobacterales bacterium]